jgi:hypothetical protein
MVVQSNYDEAVRADLPGSGSFWKFNEVSGSLVDSGGGAHNLTGTSVTYAQSGPGGLSSRIQPNFALQFLEGSGSRATGGDIFEFTGIQSFSVECWIYPFSYAATNGFIINQYLNGTDGWNVRLLTTGLVRVQRFGASVVDSLSSDVVVALNSWSHFAWSYDGGLMRLYLNGRPMPAPVVSTRSIVANAAVLVVGDSNAGGNAFNGRIARPAVYPDVVLSNQQVMAHYVAGSFALNPFQ